MQAPFLAPDDLGRPTRTVDYERGGVALSDPSLGLDVKTWRARLVGDQVRISAEPYDTETVYLEASGITELSLAFDQNMRPMVAFMQGGAAKLNWYDSLAGEVVTTTLAAGTRSPYLALDDKRDGQSGSSDVILAYILGNRLCTRQQRDRFTIETTRKWFVGNAVSIKRMGMNAGLRLQWELTGLQNRLLARAFLAGWTPTSSVLSASSITVNAPTGIRAGDILCAAVVHRSALTVPAGWTLRASQACTNGTDQTVSILSENTASPADSGAAFAFTVASAGFIAAAMFVARAESGGAALLGTAVTTVNGTATNSVNAASANATLQAGELHVLVATSINAQGITTTPSMPTGVVLISGPGSSMRLAIGYQLRDLGQSISGSVAFDNGTPTSNGLAAITLRFGVPP